MREKEIETEKSTVGHTRGGQTNNQKHFDADIKRHKEREPERHR